MKALLVVDMNNDFVHDNGVLTCGEAGQKIVPFIAKKVEEFLKDGQLVIFANDNHLPNDDEFKIWPPHCVKGTWGSEPYGNLNELKEKVILLGKTKYDAFYNTELDEILRTHGVNEVHITGVCTSICIYATVQGAYFKGLKTVVYREGVADFNHQAHEFCLSHFASIFKTEIR
ncbi:cysteine hydrolase [Microaerobacter geothermalis]|uniref:cysteine hydrolase family protein n=1 Tax=Microaerobacter geothermalis TaxID=674972 RepID=UPI001F180731|nr:isochorismatase family cysteine hydrolase [Microaerobacter geothermalis]MCF6092509.1 cysteine hydrolase [Microaerobacter geothermalis]